MATVRIINGLMASELPGGVADEAILESFRGDSFARTSAEDILRSYSDDKTRVLLSDDLVRLREHTKGILRKFPSFHSFVHFLKREFDAQVLVHRGKGGHSLLVRSEVIDGKRHVYPHTLCKTVLRKKEEGFSDVAVDVLDNLRISHQEFVDAVMRNPKVVKNRIKSDSIT